jgi:hypothetical protein
VFEQEIDHLTLESIHEHYSIYLRPIEVQWIIFVSSQHFSAIMPKRKERSDSTIPEGFNKVRKSTLILSNFVKTEFENIVVRSSDIRSSFLAKEMQTLLKSPVSKWSKVLLGKVMTALCPAHALHADDEDTVEVLTKYGQYATGK